jgi:hypothetical protein
VCVFLCLCAGRGLATSWSPVQGVLPTVPDQETEETQPYAQKREQAPTCGSNEEEKKNSFGSQNPTHWLEVFFPRLILRSFSSAGRKACESWIWKRVKGSGSRPLSRYIARTLASHRGGPGPSPGLVMWDLWWTKWCWGRFSPSTWLPLPMFILQILHNHHHLSTGAGTIGQ